jgi:hypothetical protein
MNRQGRQEKLKVESRITNHESLLTLPNICLHPGGARFAIIGVTVVLHFRGEGAIMKKLIIAATVLTGLGGCIAVPVHTPEPAYYGRSYGAPAYYGPSVGLGVSIYSGPRYYGGRYRHHHWR